MAYTDLKTVKEYYLPLLTFEELVELKQAIQTQIEVNASFYNDSPNKPLNECS